jgi:hypothetical protein
MASIFVSFIHEEEQGARTLDFFIRRIFGHTIDTFMSSDKNAIYAGEDWMKRIFNELKTTKILISLLSPASVDRPWINFEAGAAWMGNAVVIPICVGGLTIGKLPKPYSSLQAIEMDTVEGAYYLFSSIAHHLDIEPPKRPFFSETPMSSWTDAQIDENKKLCNTYRVFTDFLKMNWQKTESEKVNCS